MYSVLELEEQVTMAEIGKKYRKLALIHHPDKGGERERFDELVKAYDVLRHPGSRARHDSELALRRQQRVEQQQPILETFSESDQVDADAAGVAVKRRRRKPGQRDQARGPGNPIVVPKRWTPV